MDVECPVAAIDGDSIGTADGDDVHYATERVQDSLTVAINWHS
jgi:hypothetical protein